jgi:uncharacterized coiled-coil protein SlyX
MAVDAMNPGADMSHEEDRIAALEIALTHLERLVEELNAVILDQATRLDRVERHAAALSDRLTAAEEALPGAGSEDPPPPHW